MQHDEIPFWLQHTTFTGREDDPDGDGDGDEGNDGDDDGEEDEGEDGDGTAKQTPSEAEALREALRKERKLRRVAEREQKKLSREKESTEKKEAEDATAAQKRAEESEAKTQRLASRLLNNSVRDAVLAEANKLKFIDASDALTDDVLSIARDAADQDEDDPSIIEIDTDAIKDAVKQLAEKKKHLIAKPNDGTPSASRITSKTGTPDGEKTAEQKLLDEYPSLR